MMKTCIAGDFFQGRCCMMSMHTVVITMSITCSRSCSSLSLPPSAPLGCTCGAGAGENPVPSPASHMLLYHYFPSCAWFLMLRLSSHLNFAAPPRSSGWSPMLWLPPMSASCDLRACVPVVHAMAAATAQGEYGKQEEAAFLEYMLDVCCPRSLHGTLHASRVTHHMSHVTRHASGCSCS